VAANIVRNDYQKNPAVSRFKASNEWKRKIGYPSHACKNMQLPGNGQTPPSETFLQNASRPS